MSLEPTTIGRFRILGELGRGAMGVVYLAEDPRLKRNVAIKVVRDAGSAHAEILERFQREAELSARLAHPNLITIFDVGEAAGVGPYLAMEVIDGEPLSRELARGPMKPERAALVLVQALHAVEAAHAGGVIHRDIKAENFMVSKAGLVKLMDFGIARGHGGGLATTSVFCTPAFAAPEVLDRQPPSAASDRWAFAVTAFQCVTGELPFQAESVSAVLYQIAHEPPRFPPGVDPVLFPVFERAFQKAPEDRYPDLRSFLKDLLEAMPLPHEARAQCFALLESPEAPSIVATMALALGGEARGLRRRPLWPFLLGAGFLLVIAGWGLGTGRFLPRRLSVATEPSGAQVWIDGRGLGATPVERARIPRKALRLRVEKEGFVPLDLELKPQDRQLRLDLAAKPLQMRVESQPAGAEVFLDGELRGLTPMEALAVPAEGAHRLILRKPGYEPWSGVVGKGEPLPERITLKRSPKATPKPGFWKKLFGKD
ncbi:MAG: Serine/threonine-protein kinase PknB [Acidobacteria bacterium ADurb.Bin340]|nr:MAG: Serine/threonine-protein kinase PknB [Acidobacteria bacterium ADurb.Bin340]HQL48137.1 serine/threonine-protein kinase [Holophaga sp.]